MNYEKILDNTFANGALWKHRTFRTVLDPFSSEYSSTSMEQKISFLKTLVNNKVKLSVLIKNYKMHYIKLNRRDIAIETEKALILIIEHLLKEKDE